MGKLSALDPLLTPDLKDLLHEESQFIEHFHRLITTSIEPPFAISIDGLWGTGKTTVMKLLQEKLKDEYSTFWFNPWEYRETESVVMAFLQKLAAQHPDEIAEMDKRGEKMFKVLLKAGIGAALKIYTKGNVSLKDVEKDLQEIEDGQTFSYEDYKNSVETVKHEFKELIDRICAKYSKKNVVIFFDDLDRCLPKDAIQLLEALKNLFVIPECRVIFICGIDTRVAKQFIDKHYNDIGENFAINYFRKIFNLTISMPYYSKRELDKLLPDYIRNLYGWEKEQAEKLASMIAYQGITAEMTSVRKFLNVVHNFYTFLQFYPNYEFTPDYDLIVSLFIIKEAWLPLYEQLLKEGKKKRVLTLPDLLTSLMEEQKKKEISFSEQEAFFQEYFLHNDFPFRELSFGAEFLRKYPTLG